MESLVASWAVVVAVVVPAALGLATIHRTVSRAGTIRVTVDAERALRTCGAKASHASNLRDAGEILAQLNPDWSQEIRDASADLAKVQDVTAGLEGEPCIQHATSSLAVVLHREQNDALPELWPNWIYRLRYREANDL